MKRRTLAALLPALLAGMLPLGAAHAQDYPARPIRLVVSFAPGGVTDVAARLYAKALEQQLKQPIIVENKPGAGGTIGANFVLNAAPDGYTLLFAGGTSTSSIFIKNGAIDSLSQLEPVSVLHRGSYYIFVSPKLPVKSLPELIAYSKANPGKLNLGVQSSTPLLSGAWLKAKTGFDYTPIPYKSGALVAQAIQAGDVHVAVDAYTGYRGQLESGAVKVLAVASDTRSRVAPDVPTTDEAGIPGFYPDYVQGLWAPKGTPRAIVDRLASAAQVIFASEELRDQVRRIVGAESVGAGPADFRRAVEKEMQFWTEAARIANYKPE